MRPSKHLYYLNIAKNVSNRSTCLRRKYGAVIVKNDEIVSTGYNGSPRKVINCLDHGSCYRKDNCISPGERYELCLAGETRLLLSNGLSFTMEELYNSRRVLINTLSYSLEDNTVVETLSENLIITDFVNSLYEITIDGSFVIRCTPEHRFLESTHGEFIEASLIKEGAKLKGMRKHDRFYLDFECVVTDIKLVNVDNEPVFNVSVPIYENFAIELTEGVAIFSHNCHSVHAEANAIISAPRERMLNSTLYLVGVDADTNELTKSNQPCAMCRRLIINAGISEIVIKNENDDDFSIIKTIELIDMENSKFSK